MCNSGRVPTIQAADTITGLRENVADIYSKHGINGLLRDSVDW